MLIIKLNKRKKGKKKYRKMMYKIKGQEIYIYLNKYYIWGKYVS